MSNSLSRDALLAEHRASGKPRDHWLVGAEFERHLLRPDGMPLPYFGTPGVGWLLRGLAKAGGELVFEGDNPIALFRGGASATLEPGGQFELSGSAGRDLQPIAEEAQRFSDTLDTLLAGSAVRQSAIGYTPFARMDQIDWVPKGRYKIMREHLAQTGALAHDMMKGTCAIQATYDYADEADCNSKVSLATRLGPLTTAMFANSPYRQGKPSGYMSYRGHVWTQTDPARTGMPDAAESFSFAGWVDYLMNVPMMFRKDAEGNWVAANGQTFAEWLADPNDTPPDRAAWELHLTSVFSEVRVKHTIEVRGADCVPLPLAMSFVSLFKGLFYCDIATVQATELAQRFVSHGTKDERFATAVRDGLHGVVGGRPLVAWAEELLELSDAALIRCAPDDRRWLHPLFAQVERGESPARTLLRALGPEPSPADLIAATPMS